MEIKNLLNKKNRIYKKIFNSEEGKYILNDIYKFCRIHSPSYVEGSSHKTAYNEGAKSFAYHIQSILKQSDIDISKFIEEYNKNNNHNILKGNK